MSAAQVLSRARAAGIRVSIEGDVLTLEADSAPSHAQMDDLKRFKADIIQLLRPGNDGWSAVDWQLFFEEHAGVAEVQSNLPRSKAQARAFACCLAYWLKRNPARSEPGRCLGCGGDGHPHPLVPFGNQADGLAWLHHRCWPSWYQGRRAEGVRALAAMGIEAPADP